MRLAAVLAVTAIGSFGMGWLAGNHIHVGNQLYKNDTWGIAQ